MAEGRGARGKERDSYKADIVLWGKEQQQGKVAYSRSSINVQVRVHG